MKRKLLLTAFASIAVAVAATSYTLISEPTRPSFHDYRVMTQEDYTELIDPTDNAVREKARALRFPEEAYLFVRDKIAYSAHVAAGDPYLTLKTREGSCLGKAALLASLYRAMGIPHKNVRVVMGIVSTPNGLADHAWVDLEYKGRCYQQDPSLFLGSFAFDQFMGAAFADKYAVKESIVFNDEEFGIVSQLNRMR